MRYSPDPQLNKVRRFQAPEGIHDGPENCLPGCQ